MAPAVRQQRPPKWPHDRYAPRQPAPSLWPLASAAFGHGDLLGILRMQGALVVHVVPHNNNKYVSSGQAQVHVLQYWYRYCSTAVHTGLCDKVIHVCNFATWLHILRNQRISDSPGFIRFLKSDLFHIVHTLTMVRGGAYLFIVSGPNTYQ